MSSKDPLARIARLMVQVNIGAGLGLIAWIVWSGWLVATGQLVSAPTPAEIRAWMAPPPPSHLEAAATLGPLPFAGCHDAGGVASSALRGGDL